MLGRSRWVKQDWSLPQQRGLGGGWRCPQCYAQSVVSKDAAPSVTTLRSSENASLLMGPWPLRSPSALLYQPGGGAVLRKLG